MVGIFGPVEVLFTTTTGKTVLSQCVVAAIYRRLNQLSRKLGLLNPFLSPVLLLYKEVVRQATIQNKKSR
jgi:hypothetical protein